MVSYREFFSLLFTIISLTSSIVAQSDFIGYNCTNDVGNYTQNSTFQANLNRALSSLPSNIDPYGFSNSSVGQDEDQVNAIVLCRGDVDLQTCRDCVNNSVLELTQVCPNQREAIGWYDDCKLRYSNKSIFGIMTAQPSFYLQSSLNATNTTQFNQAVNSFADNLRNQASNGSFRKLAAGKNNSKGPTIYGLMQCTPDITAADCKSCLDFAKGFVQKCCYAKLGARFFSPSCNFQYETFQFFDETAIQSPPPPLQLTKGKKSIKTTIIIICIVVPTLLALLSACIFLSRRKWQMPTRGEKLEGEDLEQIRGADIVQYDFDTIKAATNDFSTNNMLGKGGFGEVYKGTLPNGKEIAVKRLSKSSGQGEKEFRNEVLLVAKLQHKNLVRLLGFCLEKTESLLVYEFLSNGSLDKFLFDPAKRSSLDWEMRYKVIEDVAKGLLYLHEDSRLRVIHRDLKASNVLLDEDLNAKISDFGMARLFLIDENEANTNRIVGTYGYMAPEYAMHGLFSIKSDVYSYGVLVLEIVSGKRNYLFGNGETAEDLLSYAYKSWLEGTVSNLVDPLLKVHPGSIENILRCIHIALLCVQESVTSRPTMAFVVLMLHTFSVSLPKPSEPGFFTNRISIGPYKSFEFSETSSSSGQTKALLAHLAHLSHYQHSINEASVTELYPR